MPSSLLQQFADFIWSDPSVIFITALVIGFGGAFISFVSWSLIKRDRSRKNWPSVSGQITSSEAPGVIVVRASSHGSKDIEKFIPHVKFSYTVDGTIHHGEMDVSYDGWNFRSTAERLVSHYPVGMVVPVYYDPQNPKNSVLVRSSARNIFGLIGGILILILGIVIGCIWFLHVVSGFVHS